MQDGQPKLTKKGKPMTEFVSCLSREDAHEQSKRWLVLRNKTRLRIIELLNRYDGLLCVSEVAEVLEESKSAVSGHLALLRAAKMVKVEKYLQYAYYTLESDAFDYYRSYLGGFHD